MLAWRVRTPSLAIPFALFFVLMLIASLVPPWVKPAEAVSQTIVISQHYETGGTCAAWPRLTTPVTDASNTTPIVIATGAVATGLATGDTVVVSGVTGNTAAN